MRVRPLPEWPEDDGRIVLGRFGQGDVHAALDDWLLSRLLKGWSAQAIVVAAGGRVSKRTVYRWQAELVRLDRVQIADHIATFAIRRTMPPVRVSSWAPLP